MKTKNKFFIVSKSYPFSTVCIAAAFLLFRVFAASAQTGDYQYSGSLQTITLGPGTYDITAYGAHGGNGNGPFSLQIYGGGLGAEMSGEFSFSGLTTLTLLVGSADDYGVEPNERGGGGGGGGSFVVNGSTPLVVAGGGGNGILGGPGLTTTSGGNGNFGGYADNGGNSGRGGGGGAGDGSGGGGGGFSGSGSNGLTGINLGGSVTFGGSGGSSFEAGGNGIYARGGFGGGGSGEIDGNLYGPGGGGGGYSGGGGFSVGGGGGGGSYIDSSAIAVLTEVSGVASPNGSPSSPYDSPNGEIMITAVPEPSTLALAGLGGLSLLLFRRPRT